MIALPALAQKAEYDRARELLTTGHPDEAAAIYRELSKADPRNADLLLNLSIAEYKAGKFAYAAASAASALKLNPDLVPARLFLGASYLETGDFTQAIDALERVVAAAPGDKNARLMLGQALLGAGRAEEAVEHLRLASELLPSNPRVWYSLGRAYESLGRKDEAVAAWNRLAALPPSVEFHMHKAEVLDAEQRWGDAAAEWGEALKLAPQNTDVRIKAAWSLYRLRDHEQTVALLKPLLTTAGKPDIPFLYGASLLNMQQPEKAIRFLNDALRLGPGFLPARAALGQALLLIGEPAQAIPLLESAIGTDHDGSVHFQLFRAYQLTGQAAKAREALAGYQRLRASLAR